MGKTINGISAMIAMILSLPILLMMVLFDIVKFPLILLLFLPMGGLLDIIFMLKGDESMFFDFLIFVTFLGIIFYLEIMEYNIPSWLDRA